MGFHHISMVSPLEMGKQVASGTLSSSYHTVRDEGSVMRRSLEFAGEVIDVVVV